MRKCQTGASDAAPRGDNPDAPWGLAHPKEVPPRTPLQLQDGRLCARRAGEILILAQRWSSWGGTAGHARVPHSPRADVWHRSQHWGCGYGFQVTCPQVSSYVPGLSGRGFPRPVKGQAALGSQR